MKAKYVNPFTDFGFKKIFGEEASKPLLIDFLNALLPQANRIVDLTFKNPEQLGLVDTDRKAIFDIYCENANGEKFIVELQKAEQNYFKDRTVFYSTFPIREQAKKGLWDYQLKAVYCIGILDFRFGNYENPAEKDDVVHVIQLKNQYGRVFYNKLTYMYLEMPNFKKAETELVSRLDQWLFFLRNLEDFEAVPAIFADAVFQQAFQTAELAQFDPAEWDSYEGSLKVYRDLHAVIDTAHDKGRDEAKREVARNLRAAGLNLEMIAAATGLSPSEIEKL